MIKVRIIFVAIIMCGFLHAATYTGSIRSKNTKLPVVYANIGVVNKNTGAVSDLSGHFQISLDNVLNNDTLRISCIGYDTLNIRVGEFIKNKNSDIFLSERAYSLKETVVSPKRYREKVLGVRSKSRHIILGYTEANYVPGYELGVLLPIKKTAKLKKINLNIFSCGYDTLFYRINVYELKGKDLTTLVNVLRKPLYFSISQERTRNTVTLDIEDMDICVAGNCLITLESVRDMGKGKLLFCAGLGSKTYCRKISQGTWKTIPAGMGMNVLADVEY